MHFCARYSILSYTRCNSAVSIRRIDTAELHRVCYSMLRHMQRQSTILNNNKYRNHTNMNRSPTGRRPIYPNRTNSNHNILHILRNKRYNNKVMRQNNRLKLKSYRNKPNVLKALWKKFKSSINLPYLNEYTTTKRK